MDMIFRILRHALVVVQFIVSILNCSVGSFSLLFKSSSDSERTKYGYQYHFISSCSQNCLTEHSQKSRKVTAADNSHFMIIRLNKEKYEKIANTTDSAQYGVITLVYLKSQ